MDVGDIKRLVAENLNRRKSLKDFLIALYLFGSFARGEAMKETPQRG